MTIIDSISKRRSVYALSDNVDVDSQKIIDTIEKVTELVPDAFNMKSQRVVIALGDYQDKVWDTVYDVFGGKVDREKTDMFKAAYGTVLFFTDEDAVEGMKKQFAQYADNFELWSQQSNGMLQFSVWTALADMNLGASLQHYNPVIDDAIRELFDIPASWTLKAQMPFGHIEQHPDDKPGEDISKRVKVFS